MKPLELFLQSTGNTAVSEIEIVEGTAFAEAPEEDVIGEATFYVDGEEVAVITGDEIPIAMEEVEVTEIA